MKLHKRLEELCKLAIKALEEQEPKTGHLIVLKDEYGDIHEAVCSCCDENGHHKWAYCSHCGAKMVKPHAVGELEDPFNDRRFGG